MRLRFRTRMALTASVMTAVTIVVMSALLLTSAVTSLSVNYQNQSILLTKLITRNIEYALGLPDKVMERVGDQMVVSAMLSAELVAAAENQSALPPEQISEHLRRVIERTRAWRGYPLVDEFWITDDTGRAYIHSQDFEFTFPEIKGEDDQAAPFRALLKPNAPPLVQDVQERSSDGKSFKYVGVGGVDHPRIVQVGVGQELIKSIQEDFEPQRTIEPFLSRRLASPSGTRDTGVLDSPGLRHIDTDIERIVVVDSEGNVVTSAGQPAILGAPVGDESVVEFCTTFLKDPKMGFAVQEQGSAIGVATIIKDPKGGPPSALFVQHRIDQYLDMMSSIVKIICGVGIGLIIVAILVSMWMGRKLSRPLITLTEAAHELGKGHLEHRIELKADREFEILARSFNQMADSVQSYLHQLHEETQRRERLESEMRIAAELQRSLLPEHPPEIAGLSVIGWSEPAREVGGDFYDFINFGKGRMGVAIGDATDKGLPAALLSAECWSAARALATEVRSPAELLYRANNVLCDRIGITGRFITMFAMVIDVPNRVIRYSVAGHNPPFVLGADPNRFFRLSSRAGLPIGVLPRCEYVNLELALEPNDTIFLYSDGITEAPGPDRSLYGEARLCAQLATLIRLPLPEMLTALRDDVSGFTGRPEPADDITVVGLRLGS